MAYKSVKHYGAHTDRSIYGDRLLASDGNGMTYGEMRIQNCPETNIVTPEELTILIQACANKDILAGNITRPPQVETTLELAAEFYDVYLYDTSLDRVEVTDRYAVELITQLEAAEDIDYQPAHEEVVEYVTTVHEAVASDALQPQPA